MTRLVDDISSRARSRWEQFFGPSLPGSVASADETASQARTGASSFGAFGSFGSARAFVIRARYTHEQRHSDST